MQMFDVVTVGDSVLDTFLTIDADNEFAHLDKATRQLCIRMGSKVMLEDASFFLGGNATNVAVGLSRLGFKTALIAELGDDEFSQKLINGLRKEEISLDFLKQTKDAPSTFSVILNMLGDRTAFVRHVKRNHNLFLDGFETKWIYLTSMGEDWKDMYKKVLEYKTHSTSSGRNIKLAFNPGSAQIKEGPESFKDIVAACDILFVNRDEANIILHGKVLPKEERETEENLLFRIQRLGAKMIVMTDAENGSYVMDQNAQLFYEKSAKTTIVEKTGAGDAYSTGFLGAILAGKTLNEAMQWGATDAASVIEHVGAEPGLLERSGLEKRAREHFVKVKEMEEEK